MGRNYILIFSCYPFGIVIKFDINTLHPKGYFNCISGNVIGYIKIRWYFIHFHVKEEYSK